MKIAFRVYRTAARNAQPPVRLLSDASSIRKYCHRKELRTIKQVVDALQKIGESSLKQFRKTTFYKRRILGVEYRTQSSMF